MLCFLFTAKLFMVQHSLTTSTWPISRCLVTIYGQVVWFWTWFAESAPWTSQYVGHLDRKTSRYEVTWSRSRGTRLAPSTASIQCLSPDKRWLHRYFNF